MRDTGPRGQADGRFERFEAWRMSAGEATPICESCELAAEAPLVIEVDGLGTYELMCTPAETRALAVGFAFTEGLIDGLEDVVALSDCPEEPGTVRMRLEAGRGARARPRNLTVTTSCGICGAAGAVTAFFEAAPQVGDSLRAPARVLVEVIRRMHAAQEMFLRTGGTHAAAVFDASGAIVSLAEDVGRHNALDKAIGKLLLAGRSAGGCGVALSGRASFELVAKSARAGIEIVAAVSAPTALAVRTAARCGLTLCGFVRQNRATVFTHDHRIRP